MPTIDNWTSQRALIQNSVSGATRDWVRTPNWKVVVKTDDQPVNHYVDQYRSGSQTPVTQYWRNGGGPINYLWNNGLVWTGGQIEDAWWSLYTEKAYPASFQNGQIPNRVLVKALGKIADAKVNVAVALAEARKTSDLILSTASRLDKAYRAFRKGNFRQVAKQLNLASFNKAKKTVAYGDGIHKSWLEYKYGWMPLLMDVQNAAEFFAQQCVGRPTRFSVKASEKASREDFKVAKYTSYGSPTALDAETSEEVSATYEYKVKIWCELTNHTASELQQLGLANPALIAWELVPFSFVFDWFISVGNYLEGLTALTGVTVRRALESHKIVSGYYHSYPATLHTVSGFTYYTSAFSRRFSVRSYGREPLVVDPTLTFPPPMKSFSFEKTITSLALLRGKYRGHGGLNS